MDKAFRFHMLNEDGQLKAKEIASVFDRLLSDLEAFCGSAKETSREFSIVRTKLEEACFFAKKTMALQPQNQHSEGNVGE